MTLSYPRFIQKGKSYPNVDNHNQPQGLVTEMYFQLPVVGKNISALILLVASFWNTNINQVGHSDIFIHIRL